MIEVEVGATFPANHPDILATGLVGTLGVQIVTSPGGEVVTARTTLGITEQPPGSGLYQTALVAPSEVGTYTIIWDTGAMDPVEEALLVRLPVTTSGPLLVPTGRLARLLNRPCVIVHRGANTGEDTYGNPSPEEPVEVATVCELQQIRRDEPGPEGELSVTLWNCFLPAGTDLDTGDTVRVDDEDYETVGAPWEARNPRTRTVSHVEATVKRTATDVGT